MKAYRTKRSVKNSALAGAPGWTSTPVWEGVNGPGTVPLNFLRKGRVIAIPFDSKALLQGIPRAGKPGGTTKKKASQGVVSRGGLEPPTRCLRGSCSTIELPAHEPLIVTRAHDAPNRCQHLLGTQSLIVHYSSMTRSCDSISFRSSFRSETRLLTA